MITKEEALQNTLKYITEKNRSFVSIAPVDKIFLKENAYINHGKYEGTARHVYVVNYDVEGYNEDIPYFVAVDAQTGEILFTITSHGYAEDRE